MYVVGAVRPVFSGKEKEYVPLDNAANGLSHRRSRTPPGLVNVFITMPCKGRQADKVWRQDDRDRRCSVPRIRVQPRFTFDRSQGLRWCHAKTCVLLGANGAFDVRR